MLMLMPALKVLLVDDGCRLRAAGKLPSSCAVVLLCCCVACLVFCVLCFAALWLFCYAAVLLSVARHCDFCLANAPTLGFVML